jgi:hypothetical protein
VGGICSTHAYKGLVTKYKVKKLLVRPRHRIVLNVFV